jgi:hypothetical protein
VASGVVRGRAAAAGEAVAEDKLAAKLAKVTERLQADAPNLERPGAELIAWYLSARFPIATGAIRVRCKRHVPLIPPDSFWAGARLSAALNRTRQKARYGSQADRELALPQWQADLRVSGVRDRWSGF